jgi:hypothetical protein
LLAGIFLTAIEVAGISLLVAKEVAGTQAIILSVLSVTNLRPPLPASIATRQEAVGSLTARGGAAVTTGLVADLEDRLPPDCRQSLWRQVETAPWPAHSRTRYAGLFRIGAHLDCRNPISSVAVRWRGAAVSS